MEMLIENLKTAIQYRQLARSERHTREAEKKKEEFLEKLHIAEASQAELHEVKSALNGADAESKRNQLMMLLMNQTAGSI